MQSGVGWCAEVDWELSYCTVKHLGEDDKERCRNPSVVQEPQDVEEQPCYQEWDVAELRNGPSAEVPEEEV